jgi:hypothetical protein
MKTWSLLQGSTYREAPKALADITVARIASNSLFTIVPTLAEISKQ